MGVKEERRASDECGRVKTEITVHNKTFHCSGLYQNLIFSAALLMMDAQESARGSFLQQRFKVIASFSPKKRRPSSPTKQCHLRFMLNLYYEVI
jgi:hypothetical protein